MARQNKVDNGIDVGDVDFAVKVYVTHGRLLLIGHIGIDEFHARNLEAVLLARGYGIIGDVIIDQVQREIAQVRGITDVGHGSIDGDHITGSLSGIFYRDTFAVGVLDQHLHRLELDVAGYHAQAQGVGQAPHLHRFGNLDIRIAGRGTREVNLHAVVQRCNRAVLAAALGDFPSGGINGGILHRGHASLGVLDPYQQRVGQHGMRRAYKRLAISHGCDDASVIHGADALICRGPRHDRRVHPVQPIAADAVDIDGIRMKLVKYHAVAHQLPLRLHDGDGLAAGNAVVGHIQVACSRLRDGMKHSCLVKVAHLLITREGAALQVTGLQDPVLVISPHVERSGRRYRQVVAPRLKADDADFIILGRRRDKEATVAHGTYGTVTGMVQHLVVNQDAR